MKAMTISLYRPIKAERLIAGIIESDCTANNERSRSEIVVADPFGTILFSLIYVFNIINPNDASKKIRPSA